MNKRVLRFFLILGLGVAGVSAAHAQKFGITAGLNFDRLTDVTLNNVEANFESKTGWHVGIWTDISLFSVLSLRPGVRYMSAGQLFEGLADLNNSVQEDFDINLVEIPILARFAFGAPVVKPYIFAGPVIRFTAGVDKVIDNDLNSPSLAGELGVGIQLSLGAISLYPEIAYTFGLSSFIGDELIIDFVTFSTEDTQKLNTAMVRLGIGF